MKFKVFYCLFIVGALLYSNMLLFGPISLRHILSIIMFLWLCIIKEFKFDSFIWAIVVFVFFLGISSIATGFSDMFLKKMFGTYFVGIVLYSSSVTMIRKYDAFNWIFWTIMGLASLDAIVTIGQFFNNPLAYSIALKLGVADFQEDMWASIDAHNGAIGGVGAGGLFGIVKNGIFLCAATVLSLYNRNGIKWWNWMICVFFFIALFLVQERTGLIMGVFGVGAYAIINTTKNSKNIWYIFLIVVAFLIAVPHFLGGVVNVEDTRYGILELSGFDTRKELSNLAFEYFNANPMGGAYDYLSRGYTEPHNVFANAFLYGGLFGGVIMIILLIKQFIIVIKVLWKSFVGRGYSMVLVNSALIFLCITMNSLTHNNSLVKGEEIFFVIWGVVSSLYLIERHSYQQLS